MRITDLEAIVLVNPDVDPDACDSAQETAVVLIHTDEGISGVGEVDASAPVVKAMLNAPSAHSFSRGLRDLLIGEDPHGVRSLWHRVYEGTIMSGRRGMGIHVLGALDVALWDLRGKAEQKPIWQLLGGAMREHVTPYASVLPTGVGQAAIADAERRMRSARAAGFQAAKIEAVPEVAPTNDDVIAMVEAVRRVLGPDIVLMVDVAYRWRDAKEALEVMRQLEQFEIYFVETPLPIDDLDGCATLACATPIRLASGELNAHRSEFLDLLDRGRVDVVQPDPPRAGGFTECMRIAEAAEDRGRLVVPHAWHTGITTASAIHLSAALGNCPMIEYLDPAMQSAGLRRDLLATEPELVDGVIPLPVRPGLGIELDLDALESYRQDDPVRATA